MLAFVVTLQSGRRTTVRAEELRFSQYGCLELLATLPATPADPTPHVVKHDPIPF